MPWSRVIGQHRVKSVIRRAVAERRVAHAYCLWGPAGIGKDALAMEFAALLNCEEVRRSGGDEACGRCSSCVMAGKLEHPNIQFVFSLPAAKGGDDGSGSPLLKMSDDQISVIREELRRKADDPYYMMSIPNATQIRIAAIRDVRRTISMYASMPGRRVVIISQADQMRQEAANAFLKTLEEPGEDVTIILTTSRRDALLSTILSRCQQIRCDVLRAEEIEEALIARGLAEGEEALLVSRLCEGSFARAVELLGDDLPELRTTIIAFLRAVLRRAGYAQALLDEVEAIAKGGNRNAIEKMLTLLLLWLRDAMALGAGSSEDALINIDQKEDLRRFAANFAHADLGAAATAVEDAIRRVHRNVQIPLLLSRLALDLRTAIAQ